jgi:hypothetical protein
VINYTEHLTVLMRDVVARVPALSFIQMPEVLVFARFGRAGSEGAFATCHCLNLPATEPGYFFWRDRVTGKMTRRSEWFVTKSPTVTVGDRTVKYLLSFTLPRFCDQSLNRSRKERFYRRATDGWVAKLDTVIHELYHIDPDHQGIRRMDRGDGTCSTNCHGGDFFTDVADMVSQYLDSKPDVAVYEFLMKDFDALETQHGGVIGTTFRPFPSYPQRYMERLDEQRPCDPEFADVPVQPWSDKPRRSVYSEDDLHLRQFMRDTSRAVNGKGRREAAA